MPILQAFAAEEEEKKTNHSVGFFVGITSETRRDRGLALGIEGTHFFSQSFGVGGVLEYTFGDIDAWVLSVPLVLRTGKWKVYAGPGIEGGDLTEDGEFLVRAGAEYGFEVGSIEIAPQLNFDFVDGDVITVVGVLFAKPF